jgi:hypothetical protein
MAEHNVWLTLALTWVQTKNWVKPNYSWLARTGLPVEAMISSVRDKVINSQLKGVLSYGENS